MNTVTQLDVQEGIDLEISARDVDAQMISDLLEDTSAYCGNVEQFLTEALELCPEFEQVLLRFMDVVPSAICSEDSGLALSHQLIYRALRTIALDTIRLPRYAQSPALLLLRFTQELARLAIRKLGSLIVSYDGGIWTLENGCRNIARQQKPDWRFKNELAQASHFRMSRSRLSASAEQLLLLRLQQTLLPSMAGKLTPAAQPAHVSAVKSAI